jgi:hypothetical protein
VSPDEAALGSPRIHLADIAGRVTAATPGVALSDGGDPRWQTADRVRRVRGVTVVADGGGRFEVCMRVIVAWPPKPPAEIADQLRGRVREAAEREGLSAAVGAIDVQIVGVEDADAVTGDGS